MYRKIKDIPKEELTAIAKNSLNLRQVQRLLGYETYSGYRQEAIKKRLAELQIDISHFSGQGWNKNNFDYTRFKYGNAIKSSKMKAALIHLRGNQCECCKNTKWNEQDIPLEVHHLDGNHLNNELNNLLLLCPNCHALTDNWRGKNIHKSNQEKMISEEDFILALNNSNSVRQALLSLGLTGAGDNYTRAYNLIQKYDIKKFKK